MVYNSKSKIIVSEKSKKSWRIHKLQIRFFMLKCTTRKCFDFKLEKTSLINEIKNYMENNFGKLVLFKIYNHPKNKLKTNFQVLKIENFTLQQQNVLSPYTGCIIPINNNWDHFQIRSVHFQWLHFLYLHYLK